MKLAICNEMFENWKIEDVFECAATLGYDAVEIAPFTLAESVVDISQAERARIRQAAEAAKIEIAGLHWLLVSPKGLHLTAPDADLRAKTRDYFMALIQCCADFDGKIMVIGSPNERNVVDSVTADQAWEYAQSTFSDCAAFAQDKGVVLCMEPLASQHTNFITTPAEAVRMVEAVDNPNFQIILDVSSTALEGLDMPTQIRQFSQYLAHFHTNDDNGYLPGSGNVDYPPIIEALKAVGYTGYLSTEVFTFEPDPETIARRSIEFLKSLL